MRWADFHGVVINHSHDTQGLFLRRLKSWKKDGDEYLGSVEFSVIDKIPEGKNLITLSYQRRNIWNGNWRRISRHRRRKVKAKTIIDFDTYSPNESLRNEV